MCSTRKASSARRSGTPPASRNPQRKIPDRMSWNCRRRCTRNESMALRRGERSGCEEEIEVHVDALAGLEHQLLRALDAEIGELQHEIALDAERSLPGRAHPPQSKRHLH